MHSKTFKMAAALLLSLLLGLALLMPAYAEGEGAAASEGPSYADPSVIPTNGIEGWPKLSDTNSDYFCIMDADTGTILAEKGMDTETPPASLTKIMTCLVALENGDLDAEVPMTMTGVEYAISGSSNLYTQVGEVFKLEDMLYGTMLKSANDMATQVAEAVGGSLQNFLDMMNAKAEELGCTHTYFANACGMPNEEHHSSAHDLALISKAALENDKFRDIVHTKVYTIPATNMTEERTFQNHHKFLVTDEYAYEGIIGGKTGYTDLAGSCLATYVERDGRTVIVIALHCMGMDNCLSDTRRLCDYGLGEFKNVDVPNIADEILEGGTLTLPLDASFEECEVSSTSEMRGDGSEIVSSVYSWHGQPVGTLVTKKMPVVSEAEAAEGTDGEKAPAGVSEGDAAGEAAKADAAAGTAQGAGQEMAGQSKEVNSGKSGGIGAVQVVFIIAGVLLAIIVILIIVSVHLRRERERKRRRRNQKYNDTHKSSD